MSSQLTPNNEHIKNNTLNVPEKIIFIIDTVREPSATEFKLVFDQTFSTTHIIKRIVEMYVHNKIMLNKKHEFAIAIIDNIKIHWLCDFTNDTKSLSTVIESIEECTIDNDNYYDLQEVFNLLDEQVSCKQLLNQDNVIRTILFYCRSHIIPKLDISDTDNKELLCNPNFFLDVLYVHETPSSDNKCEQIYSELTKLDVKNTSYILEVSKNAAKLHSLAARLLAHPNQRVNQKDISDCINPTILKNIQQNKLNN